MRLPGLPEKMCQGIFVTENKPPVCAQQVHRAALQTDFSTPFHCLKCHCFETPPGVRGRFSCFHCVGVEKMSPFSFWDVRVEHTQAEICHSYLIFRYSLSASMQPYLETNEHGPIFCTGISQSRLLSLVIEAMITDA